MSHTETTVAEGSARVVAMIGDDVTAGVIPWDVPDFAALHDFVDANEYLAALHPEVADDETDEQGDRRRAAEQDFDIAVSAEVNAALTGSRSGRARVTDEEYALWLVRTREGLATARANFIARRGPLR